MHLLRRLWQGLQDFADELERPESDPCRDCARYRRSALDALDERAQAIRDAGEARLALEKATLTARVLLGARCPSCRRPVQLHETTKGTDGETYLVCDGGVN